MIQRYEIYVPVINDICPSDNGEWVKWEDVKHLFVTQIALEGLKQRLEIMKDGLKK